MRKVLAILLWVIGMAMLIFSLIWAWFLRDGIAPGFVESHGMEAVRRFWDGGGVLLPPAVSTPFFIGGCFAYPVKFRRRKQMQAMEQKTEGVWPPPPTIPPL